MTRIEQMFKHLKDKNEKALVGFITAGDPDQTISLDLIQTMCASGVDLLELGIPFSDPTADGPVIQRSSARALASGSKISTVLTMVSHIRRTSEIPIILFSYYNPIFAYGNAAFYQDAVAAGADGLLVVDLPPEESDEMTDTWGDDLALIRLIAPTTPPKRMQKIAKVASGFIYMVSKTGVTGSSGLDTSTIKDMVTTLATFTSLPICVGFGVNTPEDVNAIAQCADGVIIGSAFERLIEDNLQVDDLPAKMSALVKTFKQATIL